MKGNKKLVAIIASVVAVFIVVILVIIAMKSARATELSPHATEDGKEMIESLKAEESKAEPKAEPSKAESKVAESKTEPSVAKADSTDAPKETTLEDPYGMYVVTEEWIKKYSGYAVERNGRLYSLSGFVMGDMPKKYNVGYWHIAQNSEMSKLYMYDENRKGDVPTNLKGSLVTSSGDFPIFRVSKSEEVRVYSGTISDEVELFPVSFYGYTLNATHIQGAADGKGSIYTPIIDYVLKHYTEIKGSNPEVSSSSGPVSDVYDLERGEEYLYSWYEGTKYNERKMIADSKCYAVSNDRRLSVSVPIKLTKKDYAVMDISDLEPGIYYQKNTGVFFELID